jgi:DNA polymerase-3 subunit alpha
VYLGFTHIESLEQKSMDAILQERRNNGPFLSFSDFMDRVPMSVLQVKILIKCGALRFCGSGKKHLMWQAYSLQQERNTPVQQTNKNVVHEPQAMQVLVQQMVQSVLFTSPHKEFTLPALVHNSIEDAYDEIELLGFPVSMTDFDLLQSDYRGDVMGKDLSKYLDQTVRMVGNYVTTKSVKTVRGDYMAFGTFYDVESNFFDTTHFAQSLEKYPFSGRGVYLIEGKVVEEFGFYSLEVNRMAKLPTKADPRY